MQLPVQLQKALERELERIPSSELALASVELTASYRDPQRSKPPTIRSGAQRLAYAAVRMPATYAAVYAVFSELKARQPGLQIATLLDLGAGPGTATWAAAELFPELKRVTCLEQERGLIELGSRLASEFPFSLDWVQQDLRRFDAARHDLVILSYVIGELAPGDVVNVIQRAWNVTAGALVVIEPGTPVGYQRIIAVRDLLIGTGGDLVAPCPHMRECPMLHIGYEWCHFAARVERTSLHRRIKAAKLGHEDEKFSYVIFSRSPVVRTNSRIVRRPLKHTGHVTLELCAQAGLLRETVSRKQKALYHAARDGEWGDAWPPHPSLMQPPRSI